MTDALKRLIRIVLAAVALAIIVAGLWPTSSAPPTAEERTVAVASQIRCPFCNGESIAEATSQVARDLEVVIAGQVDSGMTDDEIYSYFSDRYGEAILMAPPLRGWGWGLWALPLLALGIGGAVIWRTTHARSASRSQPSADALERARLDVALAQIDQDVEEAQRQAARGEIDKATLAVLTARYQSERSELQAAVDGATTPAAEMPSAEPEAPIGSVPTAGTARRRSQRRLAGAAVLVAGIVGITIFVVSSADRSDSDATAGIVDAPPIDLANVTLEQLEDVVARNPDVIGMRLALAKELIAADDVQGAVKHFGQVLERERHPEALAWLGFISFQVNEPETAESYLVEAIELQPNYPQAQWWLANVRYVGLGDAAGAIAPLEALLVFDNLSEDVRDAAVELLAQARDEA